MESFRPHKVCQRQKNLASTLTSFLNKVSRGFFVGYFVWLLYHQSIPNHDGVVSNRK